MEERDGGIFVELRLDGEIESDKYACNAHCGERAAGGGRMTAPKGPSGLLVSGFTGADGRKVS